MAVVRVSPLSPAGVSAHIPGVLVCVVIALAATFVSEHHGGPQLLYALLIGLAFNFLAAQEKVAAGVELCARTALRAGVALLGARITVEQVAGLGLRTAAGISIAVGITVLFGLLLAKGMGRPRQEGLLSGCAVGICGASAALAVSAAMPATKENERFTLLAVVGVTVLSTAAMILYPLGLNVLGLSGRQSGVFLGGTIHDVAQVVAAGMMMGREAADSAAIVKLFRISLLVPVVFLVAIAYRGSVGGRRARIATLPAFLLIFVLFVVMASTGLISQRAGEAAGSVSRWLLMTAIAASGIKTNLGDLMKLGWQPVAMLAGETVFIAGVVLVFVCTG